MDDTHRKAGWARGFGAAALACGLVLSAIIALAPTTAAAANRTLDLYFTHTKERLKIVYKRNGAYVPSALRDLNRFLRDWRRNEATKMDPELFDLIWEVQQEFGGKTIHVVSAYRSPATNSMLRKRSRGVAKNSQHMAGKAIDFYIKGAKISKVREEGIKRQVGGVGYYPSSRSPFVHMDTGRVRAWPRMSHGQLARLFPDGKTLHVPSNGKPLKGYKEAQALEKAGKLQKLKGGTSVGVRSLFAFAGGGGSTRSAAAATAPPSRVKPARASATEVVAVSAPTSRVIPGRSAPATAESKPPQKAGTPKKAAEPKKAPEPKREVQVASLGPATRTEARDGEGRGLFRQLPSVSLGGLIDRFSGDEDDAAPTTASTPAEVSPVAPPAAPLTAVAVERPSEAEEAVAEVSAPPPVPQASPRRRLGDEDREPEAEAAPVVVAALTPQDEDEDEEEDIASDAFSPVPALGYARPDRVDDGAASPQNAAAALLPRPALATPTTSRQNLAPRPFANAPATPPRMIQTAFAPVRGASPALISNTETLEGGGWDLNAPDRFKASSDGVLMAQGFLGAPAGFGDTSNWPSTKSFTGVKITVYAPSRSGS